MADLTWSKGCYNNSDGGCSPNLYPRLDNRWLWQRGHGDRCLHDAETQAREGRVERWWIDDRDIRDNNVGAWSPQPAHSDTITFSDTTNKLKLLWKFCWWLANMQPRITSARHDVFLWRAGGISWSNYLAHTFQIQMISTVRVRRVRVSPSEQRSNLVFPADSPISHRFCGIWLRLRPPDTAKVVGNLMPEI